MKHFLALLLASVVAVAWAEPVTRTVELRHRPPEQMAEMVRPLAGETALIPAGNALIMRGESAVLDEIEKAIERLDVAPRRLRLTVRQDSRTTLLSEGIHVGPKTRIYSNRDTQSPNQVQSIQVLEGGWARIDAGRSIPYPTQSVIISNGRTIVQQGTEYQAVGSGFEVRPQVVGNTVHLSVRAYRGDLAREDRGVIETQEVESTVEGPLGEWIMLGSHDSDERSDSRGIVYADRSRAVEAGNVQIKVELLP